MSSDKREPFKPVLLDDQTYGGPAFPETHVLPTYTGFGTEPGWHGRSGMTLRDYFAAHYEPTDQQVKDYSGCGNMSLRQARADLRYLEADAMLKARKA